MADYYTEGLRELDAKNRQRDRMADKYDKMAEAIAAYRRLVAALRRLLDEPEPERVNVRNKILSQVINKIWEECGTVGGEFKVAFSHMAKTIEGMRANQPHAEPEPEKPAEVVYETAEELSHYLCGEFVIAVMYGGGWIGEKIRLHLSRFRPQCEDTLLLDAVEKHGMHILNYKTLSNGELIWYTRVLNRCCGNDKGASLRETIKAAIAEAEKKT